MNKEELFSLSSYQYELPENLIAKFPSEKRDNSRLMVLDKSGNIKAHRHFYDLPDYFKSGDVIVLNETKVLNARFYASRDSGGKVEIFFLKPTENNHWEILTKCGSKLKQNEQILFNKQVVLEILEFKENGVRIAKWLLSENIYDFLEKYGEPPLPPYIVKGRETNEKIISTDQTRYQTVYAKKYGAVAAPTAGLHFTPELLNSLKNKGVIIAKILLHVGYGTFSPVKAEDIRQHEMHFETYELSEEVATIVNKAKLENKKVIAVGTTSGRTLETCAIAPNVVKSSKGETNIYIYPGYPFKILDGIITNFHLPKSSLLLFISAMVGKDQLLSAYQSAINEKYRFYSYGDGMIII